MITGILIIAVMCLVALILYLVVRDTTEDSYGITPPTVREAQKFQHSYVPQRPVTVTKPHYDLDIHVPAGTSVDGIVNRGSIRITTVPKTIPPAKPRPVALKSGSYTGNTTSGIHYHSNIIVGGDIDTSVQVAETFAEAASELSDIIRGNNVIVADSSVVEDVQQYSYMPSPVYEQVETPRSDSDDYVKVNKPDYDSSSMFSSNSDNSDDYARKDYSTGTDKYESDSSPVSSFIESVFSSSSSDSNDNDAGGGSSSWGSDNNDSNDTSSDSYDSGGGSDSSDSSSSNDSSDW